jgi:GT2 family glycosyltransferase
MSAAVVRPQTSLVISTRNRPGLVIDAVASVLGGDEVPAEIVVVDRSEVANDRLQQMRDHGSCHIVYVASHERGLSRGRNTGIRAAAFESLAFTDDDILVTRTWFSTLMDALAAEDGRTVVTGRVDVGEAEVPGGFAPSTISDELPRRYRGRIGKDVLYSGNMAMTRAAIDEVGGFDEDLGPGARFPGAEDNDLGYRLLEAGYAIVYRPESVASHRSWRARADYIPLRWRYGRGQGVFFAKHASRRDQFMLRRFARHVASRIRSLPRRLWTDPSASIGDLVYLCGELSGFAEWKLSRRRSGGLRP